MVLRIWGRASSVNVQKVLWALAELELPFERLDAGGKYGVTGTDAFGAMNPMRRVPVLEEDGFVLWESHAILRHLGRVTRRLVPADAKARAIMDQWMEFGATTLQPPFITAFWQRVRTRPVERDEAALGKASAELEAALQVLDGRLGNSRFVADEDFSLADIALGSPMHRIRNLDLMPESLGNLRRWAEALAARPGYQRHVAVSYEELRVT
jgi:glutathione S-transferase